MFLHSSVGPCELREVVVESRVVSVREVILEKVGFHQESVVNGHFHDVQDVEPVSVLVLGDSEKLLDSAVHSLGLPVGLGVEST